MALQSCRSSLARSRTCARVLSRTAIRSYASDATPESFKVRESQSEQEPTALRWMETPAAMKVPTKVLDHAKKASNKVWQVNNDPKKLDAMYVRLLGQGGGKMLPEELKWLAVTHKSFDQGRRGFNDKLALMGRFTLAMEATKHIANMPAVPESRHEDEFDREPFEHEQLSSVDNLSVQKYHQWIGKEELYSLAKQTGLLDVVRWKPRLPEKLESSGVEVVLNGALLAIIGALTLQHGAVVASEIVRERILKRMNAALGN